MIIKKGDTVYTVQEYPAHWKLTKRIGSLKVEYKVLKEKCASFSDVERFVNTDPNM